MDSVLKILYDKWFTHSGTKYPFANGTTEKIENFAKNFTTLQPEFDRILELNKHYYFNDPEFGYYFRNSNFYLHCKKNNIEMVSEVTDSSIYYYPVEIEGNTIQFVLTDEFVNNINKNTLAHLKSGRVKLLLVNMVDPGMELSVLKDIEQFFNNLGITQIIALQGNIRYNTDTTITQLDSCITLYQTANEMDRYPYRTSLGYESDYVREIKDTIRPKKFLSFNRFMNRCHRTGLAHVVLKYNLLPEGYWSFLCNPNDDYEDRLTQLKLPVDPFADAIRNMVPRQIDTEQLSPENLSTFYTVSNYKKELYETSYIHIVTETQFEQSASPFISEKTVRPILNLQPFIVLGNAKTLNTLRMFGFKTFHPFIDESYDEELDPVKRFSMIASEIKKLSCLSIEEIHNWVMSIQDILIFNQKLLYNCKTYNPICNLQKLN